MVWVKELCDLHHIEISVTKKLVLIGETTQSNLSNIIIVLAKQYLQSVRNKKSHLSKGGFIGFVRDFVNTEFKIAPKNYTTLRFCDKWRNMVNLLYM